MTRAEYPWAKAFRPRCVARAAFGRDDSPRCELVPGHEGPHRADRGMFDAVWTENAG